MIPFSSRTVGAASAIPGDSMAEATPETGNLSAYRVEGAFSSPEINWSLISSIQSMNSCGTSRYRRSKRLVLEVEDSVGRP